MCTSKSACRSTEFHAVGVKTELRALQYTHLYLADSLQALRSSQAGERWVPVYSLRSWTSVPPCPSLGPRLRQGNCSPALRYHVGQSHLVFFCTCFFVTYAHVVPLDEGVNVPAQVLLLLVKQEHDLCWWQILLEDAIALTSLLSALPFLHSSPSSPSPPTPLPCRLLLTLFLETPTRPLSLVSTFVEEKNSIPNNSSEDHSFTNQHLASAAAWRWVAHVNWSTGVVVHAWLSSKKCMCSP